MRHGRQHDGADVHRVSIDHDRVGRCGSCGSPLSTTYYECPSIMTASVDAARVASTTGVPHWLCPSIMTASVDAAAALAMSDRTDTYEHLHECPYLHSDSLASPCICSDRE